MAETMKLPDGRVADLGKCRSCNADIVWARTRTGARMPYAVVEGDLKLDAKGQPFSHSWLRCFHCHELAPWIGSCVHCGKRLMPMEATGRIDLQWGGNVGDAPVWTTISEWPTIVTIGNMFLEESARHVTSRIRWESPWSIRITLDNGWAVYALSTMSRSRGFCVGRLVDSELSCIVPA